MENIFGNATLIWCILGVLFIIVEILTVSFFAVFFAVGAFAAAITAICGGSVVLQIVIFAAVSLLATAIGKPFLNRFFKTDKEVRPSTVNALIGSHGIVTGRITKLDAGQVKINGEIWMAAAEETLEEGTEIEVEHVSGAKVHVKRCVK